MIFNVRIDWSCMGIISSTKAMLYETNPLSAYFHTNVPSTLTTMSGEMGSELITRTADSALDL